MWPVLILDATLLWKVMQRSHDWNMWIENIVHLSLSNDEYYSNGICIIALDKEFMQILFSPICPRPCFSLCRSRVRARTHTYTHTCTHAYTHTHQHTHAPTTLPLPSPHTHIHTRARTHVHAHHTHARTHLTPLLTPLVIQRISPNVDDFKRRPLFH